MKPTDLSNHISNWFDGSGPSADVVISSRIRLARNLSGFPFLSRATQEQKGKILEMLKKALLSIDIGDAVSFININDVSNLDRDLLIERHLISRQHAKNTGPRGVIIASNESFTAMINEEDHLRMQILKNGLQLKECWQQICRYDDMLEKQVSYSFHHKYGYLTACPTNVGTGIRVSVMLHLPALKLTGQIEKFLASARDSNLAVRGLFGEGTEAVGDFFQLSNQVTLGISEQDIVDKFHSEIVPKIIQFEMLARQELVKNQENVIEDKIHRALGVLKNARMISSHEALFLLSNVRMGVNLSRISNIPIQTVNELFMLTQPAHLQANSGKTLKPHDRDVMRAEIIRSKLSLN